MTPRLFVTAISAFVLVASAFAGGVQRTDASLSAALLGTWEAPERPGAKKAVIQSTYTQNGLVVGFTTSTARNAAGTTKNVRIKVRVRWKVRGGVLIVYDYEPDPPGVMPKGWAQRYRILSLNADEVLFRSLSDGTAHYRRRTRAN